MQQYFTVNEVTDAGKQRAILLSVCGTPTYQLIRKLVAPQKLTEKSFAEIVKLMSDHYQPKPLPIVQHFLNTRSWMHGEFVATFVAELKKLSEHCDYGNSLNDMIRDCLMCSINNGWIQHRLLAEAKLTYKRDFELAQGLVNYYSKFLPQLSSTLAPLYALLQKKARWTWGTAQDKEFKEAKGQLTSPCLLVHFDPRRELVLSCDASPYGAGAILSHQEEDGCGICVSITSTSLTNVCTTGKRGIGYSVRGEEVSPIPIGPYIHHFV